MTSDIYDKIDEHFSKYPKRTYPKGQILIFGGENPEHIFYIAEGKVRKYDISYRGDEVVVNIFKSPAFFPMSWAINKTDNRYFYKTEVETTLHSVPSDEAVEFLKANPDVMFDLLSRLYSGMNGVLGRIVHLMSGTARNRLIYELIIECRRFGQKQASRKYLLEINESDLAARSGMSRETVNREMKQLKATKLITINKKGIVVNDLTKLETIIGGEI